MSKKQRRRKRKRTPAYRAFWSNMTDVNRLLEIHTLLGGSGPGRRRGAEVLNKSAVVLLVACWEAYLEDVVSHAFEVALEDCQDPLNFPKEVWRLVGLSLRQAKDERVIWGLAGQGWKHVLLEHKNNMIKKFHNPKSRRVDELFHNVLGITTVSKCWRWPGISNTKARKKLDGIVNVRGRIAHRVQHSSPVRLKTVKNYQGHVQRLVLITDVEIRKRLKHW
jgi:RiboL-PSP-HEPN